MKKIIIHFILILFSLSCYSQNTDINLLKGINLNRNQSLDPVFIFMTNSASPVSFASPIIIFSFGLIKNNSTLKNKSLYVAETVLVASVFSTALKYSINTERPFVTYPFIEKVTSGGSPSLPSGHTSTAFATATSLSIAFPKWYVIAPSFLWAVAVGYSRMHLGVHYPSDVLVGAVVGSGSAWLTYKLNQWINKKREHHRNEK